jgi:hypothetical protein
MSDRLPLRLARAWVRLYTCGLPVDRRDARRAEITSDVWEHTHDGARNGSGAVAASVLRRVIAGMPADLAWRVETRVMDGAWFWQRLLRQQVIPGIAVLAGTVALLGLPGAAAALLASLMALALVGLMVGRRASSIDIATGRGAPMETRLDHRRRTTLLIVLAVSVIVLATTYAYAMSLEDWGDTRTVLFVGLGWLSLAVGVTTLVLLAVDVVRTRRR